MRRGLCEAGSLVETWESLGLLQTFQDPGVVAPRVPVDGTPTMFDNSPAEHQKIGAESSGKIITFGKAPRRAAHEDELLEGRHVYVRLFVPLQFRVRTKLLAQTGRKRQ